MPPLEQISDILRRDPDYLDCLLTETEAAKFLGFSIRSLQGWRLKGGGPTFIKIGGKSVRYRRRDLIGWADDNRKLSSSGVAL